MYFFIWWTALFAAMTGVDCSHLSIKVYISNIVLSSLNNFKQLCKKDLTSPVDSLSSQGLTFIWCWASPVHGSLHRGILAIPFLLSSVFENEAPKLQKSLCACRNVSFSFCRSNVGGFIVDFWTHSAVGFLALSSRAPLVVSPLCVITLSFWCRVRFSTPINWTFWFHSCGLFSCHLFCKIVHSLITWS